MIEEDFSDGYSGKIESPIESGTFTNPIDFQWRGGQFKPISFSVTLFVDAESNIATPKELTDTIQQLYRYAMPAQQTSVPPEPLTFSVGSWYKKLGYIKDVDVTYKSPWDLATGMPLRALIRFSFLVDYSAGGAAGDTGVSDNVSKNPTSSGEKAFKLDGA
jgi:hypothetical protein